MAKELKFSAHLVPLIISGEKTCTWRLWDEKELRSGDELVLIKRPELVPFAEAVVEKVVRKKFGEVDEEDFEGHEKNDDCYKVYADYYHRPVMKDTPLTVVHFRLK